MWKLALNKMDQSAVKDGIKQIIDKRIAWPPNLTKFLDLASGVDTDEAYDHLIKRGKPRNAIEIKVWGDCAFNCRSISEDKSRALFKKVYTKWYEIDQRGEMPDINQVCLPKNSSTKKIDHIIEERMRMGIDKQRGKK